MRRIISCLVLAVMLLSCITPVSAAEKITVYVSTSGTKTGTGSKDKPVDSIETAKQLVRKLNNKKAPVEVIFEEGEYFIGSTVEFEFKDSGTQSAPVTYKAQDGAKVVFTGAVTLDISQFKKVESKEILDRLKPQAKEYVYAMDLKKQGIPKEAVNWLSLRNEKENFAYCTKPLQFFFNGERMNVSRWPNFGVINFFNIIDAGRTGTAMYNGGTFEFKEADPIEWQHSDDIMIRGKFAYPWFIEDARIESIDKEKRTIKLFTNTQYGLKTAYSTCSWYAYNILEEVDIPGEWYLDKKTSILYFYPPHQITEEDKFELGMTTEDLISVKDARYIKFEGIEIGKNRFNSQKKLSHQQENAQGNGMYIWNADNITIKNCTFNSISNNAIVMRGNNITVEGCQFYNIGTSGIATYGGGDLDTLISGNNVIRNNHFWNISTDYASNGSGAVEMKGANAFLYGETYGEYDIGVRVENNLIHNCPSTGIWLAGMENIISGNELYNCLYDRSDAGAIYCGRMWGQFGNVVENNYIHDIGMLTDAHASAGIYIDDRQTGTTVKNNILEINNKYDGCGVFINMGAYNTVENNIVINTRELVKAGAVDLQRTGNNGSENIRSLKRTPFESPLFTTKYPDMVKIFNDWIYGKIYSGNNVIENNFGVNISQMKSNSDGNYYEKEYSDELFVNPAEKDFRIKDAVKKDKGLSTTITESAFNLEDIGLKNYEKINTEELHFVSYYPHNGQKGIASQDLQLVWNKCLYADEYEYIIYEDEEMNKVATKGTTKECIAEPTGLEFGKTYYWTVTAKNTSRQLAFEKPSDSGLWSFTIDGYGMLDTYALKNQLESAKAFIESVTEGENAGEYPGGTKSTISKYCKEAEKLKDKLYGDQFEIDKVTKNIEQSIIAARQGQKIGREKLKLSESSNWLSSNDNVVIEAYANGVKATSGSSAVTVSLEDMTDGFNSQKYRFRYKTNSDSKGFIAIGYGQQSSEKVIYGDTSFYYLVKPDIIEYQYMGYIYDTLKNDKVVEEEKWYEVEFVAKNMGNGTYICIIIDGKVMFEHFDEMNLAPEKGMFSFYLPNYTEMTIEAVDVKDTVDFNERAEKFIKSN